MENQNALIVDDSITARLVLKRLLEQQSFSVDMVDSAEQALEFLQHTQPGIIFMDHMMPGMDGFSAVKAIKADAATAAIPIVMYTSKTGDLYVGQARALGAADILTKPPVRKDLQAIFQRLSANDSVRSEVSSVDPGRAKGLESDLVTFTTEETAQVETEVAPEQDRFDADQEQDNTVHHPEPVAWQEIRELPLKTGRPYSPWLAACVVVLAVLTAFWVGLQFSSLQGRNEQLLRQRDLALQTVSWALDRTLQYPSNEEPFAGERLAVLQELVSRLSAAGFQGTLVLEAHAGQFCSMLTEGGDWITPPSDMAIYVCDRVGIPAEEAIELTSSQSAEFKRFLNNSLFLKNSGLAIEVRSKGSAEPLYDYPSPTAVKTVGDWNSIAQKNNRVQIFLMPRSND